MKQTAATSRLDEQIQEKSINILTTLSEIFVQNLLFFTSDIPLVVSSQKEVQTSHGP